MIQPTIVIVDYAVGNTHSVWNAIRGLGYKRLKISADEKDIAQADALILPGVGAFEECMRNLKDRRLDSILHHAVITNKKPILGICVGMQMMATQSEEKGHHLGLNWIPGKVVKLSLPPSYAVPHVGWNDVHHLHQAPLFSNATESPNYYFDHSFHYQGEAKFIVAHCDYGIPVTAAIQNNHICGVQFHPEKSQNNGLRLFRSFFNLVAQC
jgi:imidazole glycerol-phosphate synthase subunit HisH